MSDPTGPVDQPPRVVVNGQTIIVDGDWCNVAYSPAAAIELARRLEVAVADLAAVNNDGPCKVTRA